MNERRPSGSEPYHVLFEHKLLYACRSDELDDMSASASFTFKLAKLGKLGTALR